MSFVSKLQKFFGFGYEDDDELLRNEDAGNEPSDISPLMNVPKAATADVPMEVSNEMVLKIFDKVVEVTNASIPSYFAASVNPEKQKKFLYDSLDVSVKQYLASLETMAQDKCMALWQNERDELKKEMDNQKQRAKDLEAKRIEINNQKLSSERQKSALAQRVHDLESNIIKLEAEKEQLEIENRSLVNKAKVVNVYEADMENMRQQLNELKANANANPSASVDNEESSRLREELESLSAENDRLRVSFEAIDDENSKLKQQIDSLNDEEARLKQQIDSLNDEETRLKQHIEDLKDEEVGLKQQIEDLNGEIAKLTEAYDAVKMKDEMGDAMLNDLQKRNAETVKNVQELNDKLEQLQGELSLRDAQICDLKKDIAEKEARIQEDEETIEAVEQIAEQIDLFEGVKAKLDERIRSLKEELKDVRHENDTLKVTIKNNLYANAQQQKALREEIERLKANY